MNLREQVLVWMESNRGRIVVVRDLYNALQPHLNERVINGVRVADMSFGDRRAQRRRDLHYISKILTREAAKKSFIRQVGGVPGGRKVYCYGETDFD